MPRRSPTALAPLAPADLERLLQPEVRARAGPASPLFAAPPRAAREAFARDGLLGPARSAYIVNSDLCEAVAEIFQPDNPPVATTLRVAIALPEPPGDGRRLQAVLAQALSAAVDHVFRTTAAWRVEMAFDAEDGARAAACARAGLRFEGLRLAALPRGGRLLDHAIYATTRTLWADSRHDGPRRRPEP